jgi:hypothetical protein
VEKKRKRKGKKKGYRRHKTKKNTQTVGVLLNSLPWTRTIEAKKRKRFLVKKRETKKLPVEIMHFKLR